MVDIPYIKSCLPDHLHKEMYHFLFESHLTFAISVWGGVSNNLFDPVFRTQKKCMCMMFGNTEGYFDKFITCVRARPLGQQKLGIGFYRREPSKPLFN